MLLIAVCFRGVGLQLHATQAAGNRLSTWVGAVELGDGTAKRRLSLCRRRGNMRAMLQCEEATRKEPAGLYLC
jgi:hypothetical protein